MEKYHLKSGFSRGKDLYSLPKERESSSLSRKHKPATFQPAYLYPLILFCNFQ